jgi:hypothetical protein
LERDGFVVLRGVLSPGEVACCRAALDSTWDGRGAMHRLGAVAAAPAMAALVDHPAVLTRVVDVLGWNVHVYHSHLDVHPPEGDVPARFTWHQDGGIQNRDLETSPRPRLSVKAAWWLSDLSQPGRGNLRIVPGSHRSNTLDRPPSPDVPWPEPEGAVDVLVEPGDVLLFDRRLWHSRSPNRSTLTRRAVFIAYTYRWILSRDPRPTLDPSWSPVRRQLLGVDDVEPDNAWGRFPDEVPLSSWATARSTGVARPTPTCPSPGGGAMPLRGRSLVAEVRTGGGAPAPALRSVAPPMRSPSEGGP